MFSLAFFLSDFQSVAGRLDIPLCRDSYVDRPLCTVIEEDDIGDGGGPEQHQRAWVVAERDDPASGIGR